MLVEQIPAGVKVGLDRTESQALNNSFAWLCYGAHDLENDSFENEFGAPHADFVTLLTRIGESLDSNHRTIVLSWEEVQLVRQCLDAMLSGPAALSGAQYGTHDWVLLGVSQREFRMLRSQLHELSEKR